MGTCLLEAGHMDWEAFPGHCRKVSREVPLERILEAILEVTLEACLGGGPDALLEEVTLAETLAGLGQVAESSGVGLEASRGGGHNALGPIVLAWNQSHLVARSCTTCQCARGT